MIPAPRQDASVDGGNQSLAQYARAVEEALTVGNRLTFLIHMPMYREPGLDAETANISSLDVKTPTKTEGREIDLLAAWDSWHHVRSVCNYNTRLFVGTLTSISWNP